VPEPAVALVGCGYTDATRSPSSSDTELTVAACRAAAEDAGIDPADIDGINIQIHHYPPPETARIVRELGLRDVRWSQEGGMGVSSLGLVSQVLAADDAKTILVCKTMNTVAPVFTPSIDADSGRVAGPAQFEVPYGLGYTMQRVAFVTRRWMDRY